MKCLYCGGPLTLALLKKITGAGEFCSDECRRGYQSEFNRLAVGRLQQARASRRIAPAATGLTLPNLTEWEAGKSLLVAEHPPAPGWSTSAERAPDVARGAEPGGPAGELGSLLDAVHQETAGATEAVKKLETPTPAESQEISASAPAPIEPEEEEVWMAPRGLFPLTVILRSVETGLRIPPLTPAPIFVYLQLPESLIANSLGRRPSLLDVGLAEIEMGTAAPGAETGAWVIEPMVEALRSELRAVGSLRMGLREVTQNAGFEWAETAGLTFSWPAAAEPLMLPQLAFRRPAAVVTRAMSAGLECVDPRFDLYLRQDGRQELRNKLRDLSERRKAERTMSEPTVTLPLKTVEPALNMLAAFGTAMLERQNRLNEVPIGPAPPASSYSTEELLPRLAAGLEAMESRAAAREMGHQESAPGPLTTTGAAPQLPRINGGAPPAWTMPTSAPPAGLAAAGGGWPAGDLLGGSPEGYPVQSSPYAPASAPPAQHSPRSAPFAQPEPAPLGFPGERPAAAEHLPPQDSPVVTPSALGSDGLPSGWPADVPVPEALMARPGGPASPRQDDAVVQPASGGPALPGMPPINGNVYMFGTEINGSGNDSTALEKTPGSELEKASPAEAEVPPAEDKPNFTRPGGFALSGGGTMNVGTMVVVNQPSGTVNINANSPTASTFETRLRHKEPTPLSSIAEPAGLQIPAPMPAKEMPLRMNFQGRLDAASPVQWPGLEMTPMRKKMFFGGPAKARRKEANDALSSAPRQAVPARPAAPRPMAEPELEPDKPGAMTWIKSISNRFNKK